VRAVPYGTPGAVGGFLHLMQQQLITRNTYVESFFCAIFNGEVVASVGFINGNADHDWVGASRLVEGRQGGQSDDATVDVIRAKAHDTILRDESQTIHVVRIQTRSPKIVQVICRMIDVKAVSIAHYVPCVTVLSWIAPSCVLISSVGSKGVFESHNVQQFVHCTAYAC
jgi:hypothetical protein